MVAHVSEAYRDIMLILREIEEEEGIPKGVLKKIYDREATMTHLRVREGIQSELLSIISEAAEKEA